MFRHLHEIQTGRTSSISHEILGKYSSKLRFIGIYLMFFAYLMIFFCILGFDSEGNSVDYSTCSTAEEICENATKLLTFIDLAGHQR